MKPQVFISHVHSESSVAIWVKKNIGGLLLGGIDFFVSSDRTSISGGDKWLSKIEEALKRSSVLLVICSKDSVSRPWVNFEAGGAWIAGKRVIPLCHGGLSVEDLPEPLQSLQAYELANPDHLSDLVALLAREAELDMPSFDPAKLVASLLDLDQQAARDATAGLVELAAGATRVGTGWLEPEADERDRSEHYFRKRHGIPRNFRAEVPSACDLRVWSTPVRDQGQLNSSAAFAVARVVEFLHKRVYGERLDLSRLFLYWQARHLLGLRGDSGATIRATLRAFVKFGAPPTDLWPYTDQADAFDREPGPKMYEHGTTYQSAEYCCIDPVHLNVPPGFTLERVKMYLTAGVPLAFGVFLFPSFMQTNRPGAIPLPGPGEEPRWKQAVVAMGFDDTLEVINSRYGTRSVGALLMQNSWGTQWGTTGFGFVPYDYVLKRFARDFWMYLRAEFLDTGT